MPVNMSYCRFEDTLEALQECADALNEGGNPIDEMSEDERKAAKMLLKLCRDMADDYGDMMDDYGGSEGAP